MKKIKQKELEKIAAEEYRVMFDIKKNKRKMLKEVSEKTGYIFSISELENFDEKAYPSDRFAVIPRARRRGCKNDVDTREKARELLSKWKMNSVVPHASPRGYGATMDEVMNDLMLYVETRPDIRKWLDNANVLYAHGTFEVEFDDSNQPSLVRIPHIISWMGDDEERFVLSNVVDENDDTTHGKDFLLKKTGKSIHNYGLVSSIERWTGMKFLQDVKIKIYEMNEKEFTSEKDDRWQHTLEFDASGMTDDFRDLLDRQGMLEKDSWCKDEEYHVHIGSFVIPVSVLNESEKSILRMKMVNDKVDRLSRDNNYFAESEEESFDAESRMEFEHEESGEE